MTMSTDLLIQDVVAQEELCDDCGTGAPDISGQLATLHQALADCLERSTAVLMALPALEAKAQMLEGENRSLHGQLARIRRVAGAMPMPLWDATYRQGVETGERGPPMIPRGVSAGSPTGAEGITPLPTPPSIPLPEPPASRPGTALGEPQQLMRGVGAVRPVQHGNQHQVVQPKKGFGGLVFGGAPDLSGGQLSHSGGLEDRPSTAPQDLALPGFNFLPNAWEDATDLVGSRPSQPSRSTKDTSSRQNSKEAAAAGIKRSSEALLRPPGKALAGDIGGSEDIQTQATAESPLPGNGWMVEDVNAANPGDRGSLVSLRAVDEVKRDSAAVAETRKEENFLSLVPTAAAPEEAKSKDKQSLVRWEIVSHQGSERPESRNSCLSKDIHKKKNRAQSRADFQFALSMVEQQAKFEAGEGALEKDASPAKHTKSIPMVTIMSAWNLRKADFIGYSDPYCCLFLDGDINEVGRTPVINDTARPEWNTQLMVSNYRHGKNMQFRVFDSDTMDDDMLGHATLEYSVFNSRSIGYYELDLGEKDAQGQASMLKVKVHWLQPQAAQKEIALSKSATRRVTVRDEFGARVFVDTEAMKQKVRENLEKPIYNVTRLYHTSGFCQFLARSVLFDHFSLAVIGLNAIWIAVDTDKNRADTLMEADTIFQVVEHTFCVVFFGEWLIRMGAFEKKLEALKDMWFGFDTCIVVVMIVETWILSLIVWLMKRNQQDGTGLSLGLNSSLLKLVRMLRITRVARLARILRAIPELMILIKGMVAASRAVFFTLCLMMMIIYVFAVAFTQIARGTRLEELYFGSMVQAIQVLLLQSVLPDVVDFVDEIAAEHWILFFIIMGFLTLASLTTMNMLVGVLVEVVSVVANCEREHLEVTYVKNRLKGMMEYPEDQLMAALKSVERGKGFLGLRPINTEANDDFHGAYITKEGFKNLLENKSAVEALHNVGVDVVFLVECSDFIFQDVDTMSFSEFMDTVLQLRGNNTVKVKDIVEVRKFFIKEIMKMEDRIVTRVVKHVGAIVNEAIVPLL
eukprot:TRINITY_DN47252_c0_g1_i1.p1 TRINITY_DN47252_c0_g1~~TRINITY_DN47252_c0_g1_i1.p1  ORF type:complete len:1028 (+),score=252.24 TRINITY_DN47252_c0_g1_i1:159-3242(+)